MGKEKSYREYVYGNYSESLTNNLLTGNLAKERNMIYAYFRKNYLPFFPADKNCKVLDLGCGFGNYVYAAKRCGYRNVTGIDASESVVAVCRNIGLKCLCADAVDFLKKHAGQYDVILFNDVIEHFKKEELFEILSFIRQALKREGKVIIKTMNLSNPVTGAASMYLDLTHETGFTEISMRQVLLAAGFQDIEIIGADIYIGPKPFIYALKIPAKMINAFWRVLNCLYGRTTVKIFEKNLIAVAYKKTGQDQCVGEKG